jgi:hypothetical protein
MTTINRTQCLAQFNKLNKMFTTLLGVVEDSSLLNQEFYLYKEVLIDVNQETIVGNYDSFEIVNYHNLPLEVTEDSLNRLARDKILEVYPMERQLSILGSLLERIAESSNIECEELKEMNDFINEVKRVNSVRKEFYSSNPDYKYYSTEDFNEFISKTYDGGIQEYAPWVNRV